MKISCIIASFNENPRILDVLDAVTKCESVSEIICVDDGSTDGTAEIVGKTYKKVILIKHPKNLGKVEALRTGVNKVNSQTLLLLDADYKGLLAKEIDRAINIFIENKLDCLLLLTEPMDFYYWIARKIFRISSCVTGARIIKREYLALVLKDPTLKGYELEILQNKFFVENSKNVACFQLSAVDIGKTGKLGFIQGIFKENKMWRQIINRVGLAFLIQQSLFFAKTLLK